MRAEHRRWEAWAAILMVLVGMDTFMAQPGFVQGLVDHGQFSPQQAGFAVSMEMAGIAVSTILVSLASARLSWRRLCLAALALSAAGNALSTMWTAPAGFSLMRAVVGLASGVLISYGYGVIGRSKTPECHFGYLITAVCTYGALVLLGMPPVMAEVGFSALLWGFATLPLLALPAMRWLPDRLEQPVVAGAVVTPRRVTWMALSAVFIFFVGQGMIWAYLSMIGTAQGLSEQQVSIGMTFSLLAGIGGALTVAVGMPLLGAWQALGLGVVVGEVGIAAMCATTGALAYGGSVMAYNYSSNLLSPLLVGLVAQVDGTGRRVVWAAALQMVGLAIGPALGAILVGASGRYGDVLGVSGALLALAGLMVAPLACRLRRSVTTGIEA